MKKGFVLDETIFTSLNNFSHSEKKEKLDELKKIELELENLYNKKVKKTALEKGKLFEKYINIILEFNSNVISIRPNVKTSTNEIDFHLSLTKLGKLKRYQRLIPSYIPDFFIFECKNYNKALDVTYVNKFHSILVTQPYSFGVLFSPTGVTGESYKVWKDGLGFIKKVNFLAFNIGNSFCKGNTECILKDRFPILCYSNKKKIKELTKEYECDFFNWISHLVEEIKLDAAFL